MSKSRKSWQDLMNGIKREYASVKAGASVPDITELIDVVGGNRKTIKKALDRLLVDGFLSYRVTTGLVFTGFRLRKDEPRGELHHVLELRLAIEPMAARLAARTLANGTADGELLGDFEKAYEAVADSIESHNVREAFAADQAFHRAMLQLVQNPILRASVERMEHWLGKNVQDVVTSLYDVPDYRKNTDKQHSAIFEAIVEKDEVSAHRAAYDHLSYAHDLIVDRVGRSKVR